MNRANERQVKKYTKKPTTDPKFGTHPKEKFTYL
jgi:hypothetical protein